MCLFGLMTMSFAETLEDLWSSSCAHALFISHWLVTLYEDILTVILHSSTVLSKGPVLLNLRVQIWTCESNLEGPLATWAKTWMELSKRYEWKNWIGDDFLFRLHVGKIFTFFDWKKTWKKIQRWLWSQPTFTFKLSSWANDCPKKLVYLFDKIF